MSGCKTYRIELLQRYEDSFEKLIAEHYRRNNKGKKKFEDLITAYINNELRIKPLDNNTSDSETFPPKSAKEGYFFRKKRWRNLPDLQGSEKWGRLIYVVAPSECVVYLVWIYTHKQYERRPPDSSLKQDLCEIYEKVKADI